MFKYFTIKRYMIENKLDYVYYAQFSLELARQDKHGTMTSVWTYISESHLDYLKNKYAYINLFKMKELSKKEIETLKKFFDGAKDDYFESVQDLGLYVDRKI
jgi:hypothetical protein